MATLSSIANADATDLLNRFLPAKEQVSGNGPSTNSVMQAVTPTQKGGDVVVNLSAEARARFNLALADENKRMATLSGANADSATAASNNSMIAKEQEGGTGLSTDTVVGKSSAKGGDVLIDLSMEARAWLDLNLMAVREKAKVEASRWENPVTRVGNEDSATLRAKFRQASAAEREAYVQRQLVQFDKGEAIGALFRQYNYALANNIPVAAVNLADLPKESGTSREKVEYDIRSQVKSWTDDPLPVVRSGRGLQSLPATPVVRKLATEQDVANWTHVDLMELRQQMGVDPNTSYQVTYTNTGQLVSNEMSASARQGIMDAQAAYDRILAKRLDVEASGGRWVAATPVPSSSAASPSDVPASPLRYEESHRMYLPNIADLSLEQARKSLEFAEFAVSSHHYDGRDINGGYGNQTISDMSAYRAAVKDHIGRLENGEPPITSGATTKETSPKTS